MQNFDILALAGLRVDGRRNDEIRSIKHNIALVNYADGSAYYEQGKPSKAYVVSLVHFLYFFVYVLSYNI